MKGVGALEVLRGCNFFFIREGSHLSGGSEDRAPAAMARAITVHADTMKVMYFA